MTIIILSNLQTPSHFSTQFPIIHFNLVFKSDPIKISPIERNTVDFMPESITREPTLPDHSSITETQVNRARLL